MTNASTKGQILPVPAFFNPANASVWGYSPDLTKLCEEAATWRKRFNIKSPLGGDPGVHLLNIDDQKDFCFPQGTLFVGGRTGMGAIDNNIALAKFIYGNLERIDAETATFDTHFPFQVFSPAFWIRPDGTHPAPFSEILARDIGMSGLRPDPAMVCSVLDIPDAGKAYAFIMRQVKYYCEQLEAAGKYKLCLWPVHCILGSDGHALAGVVQEARMFLAYTRGIQVRAEVKGGDPLSENYSVLKKEVMTLFDGSPNGQMNTRFIEKLMKYRVLIIAGQAASHCVKSTIDDILEEFQKTNPELLKKVYILTDCMSSVAVPDGKGGFYADYTSVTEAAFAKYEKAGMHLVRSTDPMETWPEINL